MLGFSTPLGRRRRFTFSFCNTLGSVEGGCILSNSVLKISVDPFMSKWESLEKSHVSSGTLRDEQGAVQLMVTFQCL